MKKILINVTKTELPPLGEYNRYLKQIWKTSWITNNGAFVQQLEKQLEEYLGVANLILVSNGTLALQLALSALDVHGEVITTPFTFPATTNAILWEGATPVFADIDPETYTIDPKDVERKITKKTTAILAVHVYGNPCHVEMLGRIAKKHKLKLIYDAAHAFGVEYKGKSVLTYGDASTLSFHATKIFSTGEGGAIIVKDPKIYKKIKLLKNFGIKPEDELEFELAGINAKMNELQAAMGLCNLPTIDTRIRRSKVLYFRYKKRLGSNPHIQFQKLISSKHNYCYMPICFKDKTMRDRIYDALMLEGVKPRKYFYPLTSDFAYVRKQKPKDFRNDHFPNAKAVSFGILCLPIYPSLPALQVDRITSIINRYI